MSPLMTWAVGAGELLGRPPTHARVHRLGRLTAAARSRWLWPALWVATAAAGLVAPIPALTARGPPVPLQEVLHNLSGVSFAACGLIAWRRRPDSAVGPMLTVTGFGVLLSAILGQVDSPVAFTVDLLFGELWTRSTPRRFLAFWTAGG